MVHDIALFNVDSSTNSISFVRCNKPDTKMEKALCDYIKKSSKDKVHASFFNCDDKLVLDAASDKYQTLAEKQKEKQKQLETELKDNQLVKLILSKNEGSYIKEIKLD